MIRINLLPIKAARKREYVKQQLVLLVVLIVGTLVGLYLWHDAVKGKIDSKKKEIAQIQRDIEQYNKAIGEVNQYKQKQEELNRKLGIIDSLIKGKTGPVRVMDLLSQRIPQKVWLTGWEEKGGFVKVSGEALSLADLGDFLKALKEPLEEEAPKSAETAAPGGTPAPAGPGPVAAAAPAQKLYFTNISAPTTEAMKDEKIGLSYIKFTFSLSVNYNI